ncbi:MAG: hypothetical protein MUE53_04890 [Chitinophagales bacterium]|jgi:hypothetical protein|nr:hypothetical protein [Chitinophagales bacterium]
MKKLVVLVLFFSINIFLFSEENLNFQGIDFVIQNDFKSNLSNQNYSNAIIVNEILLNDKKIITYTSFNENGKIKKFGIDKESNSIIGALAHQPNCGHECSGAETEFGALMCWIACKFWRPIGVVDGSVDLNFPNFDWLKCFFKETFSCRYSDGIGQNSLTTKIYHDELFLSSSFITFDDKFDVKSIDLIVNVDPNIHESAKTGLGQCVQDCGASSKSNTGAYFCIWDCILFFSNNNLEFFKPQH